MIKNQNSSNSNYNKTVCGGSDNGKNGFLYILIKQTGINNIPQLYGKLVESIFIIFLIAIIIISMYLTELLSPGYEALIKKDNKIKKDLEKIYEINNKLNNGRLIIAGIWSLVVFTIVFDIYKNQSFFKNTFNFKSLKNLFDDLMSNFNINETRVMLNLIKENQDIENINIYASLKNVENNETITKIVQNIFRDLYNNETNYIDSEVNTSQRDDFIVGFHISEILNQMLDKKQNNLLLDFFKGDIDSVKKRIQVFSSVLTQIKDKESDNPIPLISITNSISGELVNLNNTLNKLDKEISESELRKMNKFQLKEDIEQLKTGHVEDIESSFIFHKLNSNNIKSSKYYDFIRNIKNLGGENEETASEVRDIIYEYIQKTSRVIDIKKYNDDKYLMIDINENFRIMSINIVCLCYLISNMFLSFNINYDNNVLSKIIINVLLFSNFYFSKGINISTRNVAFIILFIRIVLSIVSEFDDKLYITERNQISLNKGSKSLFDTPTYIKEHSKASLKEIQLPLNSFEREQAEENTIYQNKLINKSIVSYLDLVLVLIILYSIIHNFNLVTGVQDDDNEIFNEIPTKFTSEDEIPQYIVNVSSNFFVNTPEDLNIYASLQKINGKQVKNSTEKNNYYFYQFLSLIVIIISCYVTMNYKYISAPFILYILVSILIIDNNDIYPKLEGDSLFMFKSGIDLFILIGMIIWYMVGLHKLDSSTSISDNLGFHFRPNNIISNSYIQANFKKEREKVINERTDNTYKANLTMLLLLVFYGSLRFLYKLNIYITTNNLLENTDNLLENVDNLLDSGDTNNVVTGKPTDTVLGVKINGGSIIGGEDSSIWFYLLIPGLIIGVVYYFYIQKDNVKYGIKNKETNVNIYNLLNSFKKDKKEIVKKQNGGVLSDIKKNKVQDERDRWEMARIISIIIGVFVILANYVFPNNMYEPNRYEIVLFLLFIVFVTVFVFPIVTYIPKSSVLDDIKGYFSGLFLTNDVETRLLANDSLISIIKFIGLILFIVTLILLCVLPEDVLSYSFFRSCSILLVLISSLIIIIKYFTNKNEKEIDVNNKNRVDFIENVDTQLVQFKNDKNNQAKRVVTPTNLNNKKDIILDKFVDNIKTDLDSDGYNVNNILINSLKGTLKGFQLEPIELSDNLGNNRKYLLNSEQIDDALLNIKNGSNVNFGPLLGGTSVSTSITNKIITNNKNNLQDSQEKLNQYKYLEGKYKIKSSNEIKNDIFICKIDVIEDKVILCYINTSNTVIKYDVGILQQDEEDLSKLAVINDTVVHATFKKLKTNEYEVDIGGIDFKKMNQEQINLTNDILQDDPIFKDLTKIINVSQDHKYIQEYRLLEYLEEYKRIMNNINSLEKSMIESIISNIVLLIDSLKKAEYNKRNYSDESKDRILLNAQKWFNNYKSIEKMYNLNIEINEFNKKTNISKYDKLSENIITTLTEIRKTREGLVQLKLPKYKFMIEKIKNVLDDSNIDNKVRSQIEELIKL